MSLVWNPPPQPPQSRLTDIQFVGDVQVAAWKQRLGIGGMAAHAHEDPTTSWMSENALAYILMEIGRRRGGEGMAGHMHKAMVKFTPQLAQPTVSGTVEALAHVWAQPEMLDMWSAWESTRSNTARGPAPSDAGAKAVLATLGMTGHTHGLDAYSDLLEKPDLLSVYARVNAAAAAKAGDPDPAPFRLSSYRGSMKRFDPLTERASTRDLALATNARMFRALCELYPDRHFGRRLLIDGCLFPAWCPQVGKGATDEEEAARRRMTPHAGARLIQYTSNGKRDLDPGHMMRASAFVSSSNFDRGYFYVAIIDQASGWPLVSTLMDAKNDEAPSLIPLLSDLYKHYSSFVTPELIAGDGAWDEEWAHRTCELNYSLAPVFRHTKRAAGDKPTDAVNQSKSVKGFTHEGQLLCMEHGRPMDFDGFERAPRGNLRPGQPAPGHPDSAQHQQDLAHRESMFRARASHKHGPGPAQRPAMKCSADWRRLCAFPRHPHGKPALYAERMALGMRLKNQMEGHFSRMQGSLSLLTEGADRVRLQDWDKVETLLHLAELRMNALSLAAERDHNGVPVTLPTDGDVAPLPTHPFGQTGRLAQCRTTTTASSRATARGARAAALQPGPTRHAVASAFAPAPPEDLAAGLNPVLAPVAATATVIQRERTPDRQSVVQGHARVPEPGFNDWSDWDDAEPEPEAAAPELRSEPETASPERLPEREPEPAARESDCEAAAVPAGGSPEPSGHLPSGAGVLIAVDFRNRRRAR
jgi:hypothetical protein